MPGFKFTENQRSDITGGFTPVTSFNPNRVLVTNGYGYAVSSDILTSDLESLTGIVNGTFDSVLSLRNIINVVTIPLIKEAVCLGYYTRGDGGGGSFYWDSSSVEADNGGTIIKVNLLATGRWKRIMDGSPIDPRIFGCKGDDVTDDSASLQACINAFGGDDVGDGINICFSKGIYRLKDIAIPRGMKIYAEQTAKDNVIAHVPVVIRPAAGATYVFNFNDDSKNSSVENLYIDGDWQNNLNLVAAIRFSGTFNRLEGNNIGACAQYGVYSLAGGMYIIDNNIQGWFGPPPVFDNIDDFRGALHIVAAGDSYVINNEIGAAEPYLAGQVPNPIDMLRDPVNRRICAIVSVNYFGNSVVTGNIFENGDRAAVFSTGLYWYAAGNRYEMCGGGGLHLRGVFSFGRFIGERFANNSLAIDGGFDDIEIGPGGIGGVTFIAPLFEKLANALIPTSTYSVKYNVLNTSPDTTWIAPTYDTTYYTLGPVDNVTPTNFPMKEAIIQTDVNNPVFNSVRLFTPGNPYVQIVRGGSPTLSGAIQFWDADNTLRAGIGNAPGTDMYFSMLKSGGIWSFQGADMFIQHAAGADGASQVIWSTDGLGPANLRLIGDVGGTKVGVIQVNNTTGDMQVTSTADIRMGGNNNWVFKNNGLSNIPIAPTVAAGTYVFLVRDNATGDLQSVTTANFFTLVTTTPSVTLGPGITGSVAVVGNDSRGTIGVTIVSATLAADDPIVTLTFGTPYGATPGITFSPESGLAATAVGGVYKKNASATSFQLASGAGGTLAAGNYSFSYAVIK